MDTKEIFNDLENSGIDFMQEEIDVFSFLMLFGYEVVFTGNPPINFLETCKN